jgi:hypothetical protein
MAFPAWRAAGTIAHNTIGVTPGAPAGLTANDIEFLLCESMDEAISLTTANGFAEVTGSPISVPSGTATIATRGALFWRRWNGTDGDPVTNDPGNHIIAQRYAISGCITSGDPWDFIQTSSEAVEDTSGSATGNSTSGADRLILILGGAAKPDTLGTAEVSAITNATLASLTERADNAGNSGNGGHLWAATGELASAGATGDTTYTKASAAFKWHFVIALKPPSAEGAVKIHRLSLLGIG